MLLPACRLHDGGDCRAAGSAQKAKHPLLFGIRPRSWLTRFEGGLSRSFGAGYRLLLLSMLAFGHPKVPIGCNGLMCRHRRSPAEAERHWRGAGGVTLTSELIRSCRPGES